jgi:hypothetical protein
VAHANAVTGASVYIDENTPLPADETYCDADGWPLPGIRLVGPGILMEGLEPDMQPGG